MPIVRVVRALAAACPIVAASLGGTALAVDKPALPVCGVIDVVLVDAVDSARAKAGDAFRFKTLAQTPATATEPAIPKDTLGYGLVMGAHHSARGGRPGHLIVDTRFLQMADGTRVAATLLPRTRYDAPVMDGSPANAPGYIGFIPFASVMTGAYNTMHYGKEIVFNVGTRFSVVVGDGLALGECRLPPDGKPSPAPSASPSPAAVPSAAPASAPPAGRVR
jgi:hypothetical protein